MTHEEYLRDKRMKIQARLNELPYEAKMISQMLNAESNRLQMELKELDEVLGADTDSTQNDASGDPTDVVTEESKESTPNAEKVQEWASSPGIKQNLRHARSK